MSEAEDRALLLFTATMAARLEEGRDSETAKKMLSWSNEKLTNWLKAHVDDYI